MRKLINNTYMQITQLVGAYKEEEEKYPTIKMVSTQLSYPFNLIDHNFNSD